MSSWSESKRMHETTLERQRAQNLEKQVVFPTLKSLAGTGLRLLYDDAIVSNAGLHRFPNKTEAAVESFSPLRKNRFWRWSDVLTRRGRRIITKSERTLTCSVDFTRSCHTGDPSPPARHHRCGVFLRAPRKSP
jgi:hypothetical protein